MKLFDKYRDMKPGWRIAGNAVTADYVVGPTVAFGAVYCMDKLLPEQTREFTDFVAKRIVKPWLPKFEKAAHIFEAQTPGDQLGLEKGDTQDQRAYKIADGLVRFLVPTAASVIFETMTQDFLDIKSNVPQSNKKDLWFSRAVVHPLTYFGSYFFLTKALPKQVEHAKKMLDKKLVDLGVDKEQADHFSHYAVWYELPAVASSLAAIASLIHCFNKNGCIK